MNKTNNKNKNTSVEEKEEMMREAASESDTSVQTVESSANKRSLWISRKRQLSLPSGSALSSDDEIRRSAMPAPGKRKDRRKEFLVRREETQVEAEKEIAEQASRIEANRAALLMSASEDCDVQTAVALNKQAQEDVTVILNVAAKSRNLKGTFQRALKDAATSISAVVDALHKRSASEENAKLQADNARLQAEVAQLRKEMTDLRLEMNQLKKSDGPPPSQQASLLREEPMTVTQNGNLDADELTRSILLQIGGMMNARFEALEGRLLPEKRIRPPLTADRNADASVSEKTKRAEPARKDNPESSRKHNKSAKTKKGEPRPLPPAPTSMEEGWTTVVKKGRGKKKAPPPPVAGSVPASAVSTAKPKSSAPVKLHAPRTSAVVITLQPGAEEKGFTYAKILAKARAEIDLPSCGITGLKFKTAATGARILEIPGSTSGDKADSLAQKIRETLEEGVAKISRPTKCAEFRVSGLDDSVTPMELIAAVAKSGNCPEETIKVGEIRFTSWGIGSAWVRCPVAAAKKISEGGRLLVGWVSAKVNILVPRPMRCYRCLQVGHVRAQCTAETDRSGECYRCGKLDHKAKACSAAPKCSLCAAANRPAEHRLGSKNCTPPKTKKGARAATKIPTTHAPAATSCPSTQARDDEAMAIS